MNKVNELMQILGQTFTWHKSRLDCFSQMLLALFTVRTVNLKEIALCMSGKAQVDSHYRRLQRFFEQFDINYDTLAIWLFCLFFSKDQKVYLCLDRTNWFWGEKPINALVLSVAYEGVAIPVLWQLLDKDGTSNTTERIAIMQRFVDLFGTDCIAGLLADREFIGHRWLDWLIKKKIPFYIRIKENTAVSVLKGKSKSVKYLFSHLNPKSQGVYENHVNVWKHKLRVAAGRSEKGELLIVVTNALPKQAVSIYLRRWEIECLFSALKTKGFCFESTHMTYSQRIEKLMGLLAVGFAWAHKIGEWRAERKPILLKHHADKTRRPQYTYFRYGLDFIREALLNLQHKWVQFKQCLKQIRLHLFNGELAS